MSKKPTIELENAQFIGRTDDSGLTVFKNIPFASALRWQAPELLVPKGVYDSDEYGPAPYQSPPAPFFAKLSGEPLQVAMDEECLNLNIWTSDLARQKKSVLFWVYGGAYIAGYNYRKGFTPEGFVRAHPEVIVVAPNYRVGVLGNINLSSITDDPAYKYSNNLALLDILAALQWTQKYISAFGGNSQQVTLYGHSAGSNAITHLLVMPMAKGLFQRAICQSSFMYDLGTVQWESSVEIGHVFCRLARASTLKELLAMDPTRILETQKLLFKEQFGGKPFKLFSPVEDGLIVAKNSFALYEQGNINVEQMMIGYSEGECDQMYLDMTLEESKEAVRKRCGMKHITEAEVENYLALYPQRDLKESCLTIHNELHIMLSGEKIARTCAAIIPVYQYVFCLRRKEQGTRALHGDPTYYVFGNELMAKDAPAQLSAQMMDAWASFVCTGDPNGMGMPLWPRYHADGEVMRIGPDWEVSPGYWKTDYCYWKNHM